MATIREQLEQRSAQLRDFSKAFERKGDAATGEDRQRLVALSENVSDLMTDLSRHDPARGSSPAAVIAEAREFNAKFAGGPGGERKAIRPDDDDVATLTFTREQLADLQRGALNRRVTAKAAITSTTAPMAGIPEYETNVFPYLRDKARILDLIPRKTTQAPSIHYFKGTTAASAAAAVAQGAAKPESSPVWTEVTADVRKLAHYTRVNDEVIADFDSFLEVVGSELLAGLIDAENAQLIAGSGVAPNLLGLLSEPSILTVGSLGTDLDAIADAFRAVRTGAAHCDPDVVVMHPNDWYSAGFLLAKDTAGQYLVGNPVAGVKPALWGVPVVLSEAMPENSALVANLKVAATAYVRQAPVVEVSPGVGTTEFISNQTLIRAEERLALAVHHPRAICVVTAV